MPERSLNRALLEPPRSLNRASVEPQQRQLRASLLHRKRRETKKKKNTHTATSYPAFIPNKSLEDIVIDRALVSAAFTSAYVSIRQHTSSAYVSVRQRTSAYVSIREHPHQSLAYPCVRVRAQVRYFSTLSYIF